MVEVLLKWLPFSVFIEFPREIMNPDLQMAIELHNKLNNVTALSNKSVPGRSPVRIRKKRKATDETRDETGTDSIVDPSWEISDPTPDIHSLFQLFDRKYFWGKLESIEVKWSPRMYSCAGVCTYKGRLGGCVISLSLPLLRLRPRKDLVETLLHEMIHGYLFVADKNRDRGEHGPKFHEHMYRINREAGTKITVYHTFHEEVKHYQQHWWRCAGVCQSRPPYFGLVKRSMNRAPGPSDLWWAEHLDSCGGQFSKIREPEGFKARGKKSTSARQNKPTSPRRCKKKKGGGGLPQPSLDKFFSGNVAAGAGGEGSRVVVGVPGLRDPGTVSTSSTGTHKTPALTGVRDLQSWAQQRKPDTLSSSSGASKTPRVIGLRDLLSGTESDKPCPASSLHPQSSQEKTSGRIVPFTGRSYVLGGGAPPTEPRLDKVHPATAVQISLLSDSEEEEEILTRKVHCPSCSQEMYIEEVDAHFELCLEAVFESSFQEPAFPEELTDEPKQQVSAEEEEAVPTVLCPVCGVKSSLEDINQHLDNCLV